MRHFDESIMIQKPKNNESFDSIDNGQHCTTTEMTYSDHGEKGFQIVNQSLP